MQTIRNTQSISGNMQEGIAAPYDFTISEVFTTERYKPIIKMPAHMG
jgi:hypothetical protein